LQTVWIYFQLRLKGSGTRDYENSELKALYGRLRSFKIIKIAKLVPIES